MTPCLVRTTGGRESAPPVRHHLERCQQQKTSGVCLLTSGRNRNLKYRLKFWSAFDCLPAKLGPRTPLNMSGSKNGAERPTRPHETEQRRLTKQNSSCRARVGTRPTTLKKAALPNLNPQRARPARKDKHKAKRPKATTRATGPAPKKDRHAEVEALSKMLWPCQGCSEYLCPYGCLEKKHKQGHYRTRARCLLFAPQCQRAPSEAVTHSGMSPGGRRAGGGATICSADRAQIEFR
jgi:hypothetical protein